MVIPMVCRAKQYVIKNMNIKKDVITPTTIALQNYFPYLAAVLNPFFSIHPEWECAFYSAIGLFGIYMAYNQEDVNEIVEFIKEHPDEFRSDKVESKEFKKGFLMFTEQYLKQRLEQKKKILKKIFLSFTVHQEKSKFELERLNDIMLRISISALEFLVFIKTTIFPAIENQINIELEQDSYKKSDRSIEWWHDFMIENKSLWEPIAKWINDNYNPNSYQVKVQYSMLNSGWPRDILHRVENLERAKTSEMTESVSELVSLGILRIGVAGGTYDSGAGSNYNFTNFGRRFLKYIELDKQN